METNIGMKLINAIFDAAFLVLGLIFFVIVTTNYFLSVNNIINKIIKLIS